MLDPRHNPFIEQVKADLAEGQAVLANFEADAQQRLTERDNQSI
jgi:hypothetical protein